MTEGALESLREKIARLNAALPNLINETQRTAAYGDRSDSAEYKDAKSKLRSAHRQILIIENQIKRAVVIKSGLNTSGTVQLGSIVVLEVGGLPAGRQGAEKTFQILGSHETDPDKGRISSQSPLGAALINHRKGDIITIQTGGGAQTY